MTQALTIWTIVVLTQFWTVAYVFATSDSSYDCRTGAVDSNSIQIAAILPNDNERMFSIMKVSPAIALAKEKVYASGMIQRNISVRYANSNCNTKDAPIEAFRFYMHNQADVFFGPVCDYSLAPVARYAPYWNIPVISAGGFAHDFGANKRNPGAEFSSLTRVGPTFNSLAECLIRMVYHYNWESVKVIYDGAGHTKVNSRFCFLAVSALIHYIKKHGLNYDFHMFVPRLHKIKDLLEVEVGTDNGEACTEFSRTVTNVAFRVHFSGAYVQIAPLEIEAM